MPKSVTAFKKSSPKKRSNKAAAVTATLDSRVTLACALDRNADLLIFLGNHLAAERLSLRAQALREARV